MRRPRFPDDPRALRYSGRGGRQRRVWLALAFLAFLPATAFSQGNDATTVVSPQTEQGPVEAGAGTLGDTTTGSSGPSDSDKPDLPEPLAAEMPMPPLPEGPLARPGMLPVTMERASRCDIIEHGAARERCEQPLYRRLNAKEG